MQLDFVAAFHEAGLSLLDRGHPRTVEYYDAIMDDIVSVLDKIKTQSQLNEAVKVSLGRHRAISYYANLYGSKYTALPLKEEVYCSGLPFETAYYCDEVDEEGLREYFEVMVELLEFSVKVSEAKSMGLPEPTL